MKQERPHPPKPTRDISRHHPYYRKIRKRRRGVGEVGGKKGGLKLREVTPRGRRDTVPRDDGKYFWNPPREKGRFERWFRRRRHLLIF